MFPRLLSAVGLAAVRNELAAMARRTRRRAILITVATLLWLLALGFAIAALAIWLAGILGPIAACGIIAGAFAVIALIVQLIAATWARREPPSSLASLFQQGPPGEGDGDANVLGSMAIIAFVGYLLGRHFGRR